MILYSNSTDLKKIDKFIRFFIYPLWDLNLKVGYAVRSENQAIELSTKDHVIKTSMLDSRIICGSQIIYEKTINKFFKEVSVTAYELLENKINEREEKLIDIGYDYFKNEPNIKESEGSLRDINLIFWSLKIFNISRKQENSADQILTKKEKRKLISSLEFLLLLRCFLHYESDRNHDKLTFEFQHQISKLIFPNFKKNMGINSRVEKMMKNYFFEIRKTKNLAQIIVKLIKENFNKVKLVYAPSTINLSKILSGFLKNLTNDKNSVNEQRLLFDFSSKIKKEVYSEKKNIFNFKKILFSSDNKKILLLNDLGILQKIIPEFSRISDLPQFDRYHSLTVGQHTLRALNILKELKENKPSNQTYIFAKKLLSKNKQLKPLYYSTLLHDIGKGSGNKHSQEGSKLSRRILKRLNEDDTTIFNVQWLIENHLMMSNLAFKRDLGDFSVIKKAAEKIGSTDRLVNLFLLTVFDISAVDHGLWNDWKSTLLCNLFEKLENEIKRPKNNISLNEKILLIKSKIIKDSNKINSNKIKEISRITYPNYWLLQSKEMITFQIESFFLKKNMDSQCIIRPEQSSKFYSVIIFTKDRPKLFLDLISIFTSERISIHQARIFTLADQTVIDTFTISLNYLNDKILTDKYFDTLSKKLLENTPAKFDKLSNYERMKTEFLKKKIEINIDNKLSSTYTVLTVKTNDRFALLYDLSKILLNNRLVIFTAKISTDGDFVEDSFHIRTEYGSKLLGHMQIKNLEAEIYKLLSRKVTNAN